MTLVSVILGLWFLTVIVGVSSAAIIVPNGAVVAVFQLGKFLKSYPSGFYVVVPFITKKILLKPGMTGVAT
jgi:regulator of protease activity HflC (stomatin/prohibitin superfamily)